MSIKCGRYKSAADYCHKRGFIAGDTIVSREENKNKLMITAIGFSNVLVIWRSIDGIPVRPCETTWEPGDYSWDKICS